MLELKPVIALSVAAGEFILIAPCWNSKQEERITRFPHKSIQYHISLELKHLSHFAFNYKMLNGITIYLYLCSTLMYCRNSLM